LLWQDSIGEQQGGSCAWTLKCKWPWMPTRHVQVDYKIKGRYIAPPFDTNLLTTMWHLVTTSQIFVSSFFKYVKLVELAMILIVGNVKDERYFSTLASHQTHHPFTIGCAHVCATFLYYTTFPLWKMHWVMEMCLTPLVLWRLGCNDILCETHKTSKMEEALVVVLHLWLQGIYIAIFCNNNFFLALLVSNEFQA